MQVKSKAGEVIKPGMLKTLEGKGLPFHKKPFEFGNMFIVFKVIFPETLGTSQMGVLNAALGKEKPDEDDMQDDVETCMLKKFDKA